MIYDADSRVPGAVRQVNLTRVRNLLVRLNESLSDAANWVAIEAVGQNNLRMIDGYADFLRRRGRDSAEIEQFYEDMNCIYATLPNHDAVIEVSDLTIQDDFIDLLAELIGCKREELL